MSGPDLTVYQRLCEPDGSSRCISLIVYLAGVVMVTSVVMKSVGCVVAFGALSAPGTAGAADTAGAPDTVSISCCKQNKQK